MSNPWIEEEDYFNRILSACIFFFNMTLIKLNVDSNTLLNIINRAGPAFAQSVQPFRVSSMALRHARLGTI